MSRPASKRFMNALAIARAEDREKRSKRVKKAPAQAPNLKRYIVTIRREIEHRAEVEVEAESQDVAKQLAETVVDNHRPSLWREGDVLSNTVTVKVAR